MIPMNVQIPIDFSGDITALECLCGIFAEGGRPPEFDKTVSWLVRLIGQKACLQVEVLESAQGPGFPGAKPVDNPETDETIARRMQQELRPLSPKEKEYL